MNVKLFCLLVSAVFLCVIQNSKTGKCFHRNLVCDAVVPKISRIVSVNNKTPVASHIKLTENYIIIL